MGFKDWGNANKSDAESSKWYIRLVALECLEVRPRSAHVALPIAHEADECLLGQALSGFNLESIAANQVKAG